jgi:hypothetical protein
MVSITNLKPGYLLDAGNVFLIPFSMIECPRNIMEFEKEFATEEQCRGYIMRVRYKGGIYIPDMWKQEVMACA